MAENKKPIPNEMYLALQKALPAKAVAKHPTKTFLSTIKAIYVIERLNEVFGVGMWKVQNEVVREDSKHIVVKSVLTFEEYLGYFESYGGNDNADLGDAYKGACTDALTKIGSYLGVAMEVFKGEGNTEKPEAPKATQPKAITPAKVEAKPVMKAEPVAQTKEAFIASHHESEHADVAESLESTRYATSTQKAEIIKLLSNQTITQAEKTKMLLNLDKLDETRAAQSIKKLTDTIKEREGVEKEIAA